MRGGKRIVSDSVGIGLGTPSRAPSSWKSGLDDEGEQDTIGERVSVLGFQND